MLIPKSKSKRRQFFIELNYLEKVKLEEARHLIAKGDISSVVRGIETLMQSHHTTSKKNAFSDSNSNFVLEDFHDSLEDEGYLVDYGKPSKQDFEIEDIEWDNVYRNAYSTRFEIEKD